MWFNVGMTETREQSHKGTTKDGAFAGFVLGLLLGVFALINGGLVGALIGFAVSVVSLVIWLARRGAFGAPPAG